MLSSRARLTVPLIALTAVLLAACGGAASTTTTAEAGADHDMAFSFGEPADASDTDRTVEIVATDDFHFNPAEVSVSAGETKEVTWRFTEPGTVLIGCHQPGHYDAGMKGEITVEP